MLSGIAHVGIRVSNLERSRTFYELLGFQFVMGPIGSEPVAILRHPSGIEVNLVINAATDPHGASRPNPLMDVPQKQPGFTHLALLCPDLDASVEQLRELGVRISSGPVSFPQGARGCFIRDPDANVIELHQSAQDVLAHASGERL
jgi:lactoylglutathione lyase